MGPPFLVAEAITHTPGKRCAESSGEPPVAVGVSAVQCPR